MLRVWYSDTTGSQRWNLCGQLAGPWVAELRSCWQQARRLAPLARAILDLSDVTFIDEAGESLLCEMQRAGTEFVASGVENKHLIASLKGHSKRPLRRRVDHLGAPCIEPGTPEGGN